MVRGRYRSRTFRRVRITTTAGERKVHFERKKNGAPQCADCGTTLKGTARGTPHQIQKLSKTQRRPERPYGGVLCSACTKKKIIGQARATYQGEVGNDNTSYTIGTLCTKTVGRDAGKLCVIIDTLQPPYVMIDGQTRRRKCNVEHLELLPKKLDIKKNVSHEEVKHSFKTLAITLADKKTKKKTTKPKKGMKTNTEETPKKK